jgi:hypothetical protein
MEPPLQRLFRDWESFASVLTGKLFLAKCCHWIEVNVLPVHPANAVTEPCASISAPTPPKHWCGFRSAPLRASRCARPDERIEVSVVHETFTNRAQPRQEHPRGFAGLMVFRLGCRRLASQHFAAQASCSASPKALHAIPNSRYDSKPACRLATMSGAPRRSDATGCTRRYYGTYLWSAKTSRGQ